MKGIYEVWHRDGGQLIRVSHVDARDKLGALILPMLPPGAEGSERVTRLVENARPTTFGDVIVAPDGAAYEIADTKLGPGFAPIDLSLERLRPGSFKVLLAEMRNDAEAAKARDAEGEHAVSRQPEIEREP